MKCLFSLPPLALALLLAAPTAQAQGVFDMGALTNTLAIPTGPASAPRKASAAASATTLAYTPTPALRQQTVRAYAARLQGKNPAAAQAVTAAFGSGKGDYGQAYRTMQQGTGLRENDTADVLSLLLITGWMIVNNVQDGNAVTAPMARGVRAQVAPALAANAQIRSRAAQVGEELKLQAVVLQSGWSAASQEHTLPAYRQGIAALFKTQYGMDVSQLKLTSQGFTNR